jgi:hypothetical protein
MRELYAHHNDKHTGGGNGSGNGNGGGKKVPEIDGSNLILAILFVCCFFTYFKKRQG